MTYNQMKSCKNFATAGNGRKLAATEKTMLAILSAATYCLNAFVSVGKIHTM
jgi:hypothetical protein